jgi:hypothetical protein
MLREHIRTKRISVLIRGTRCIMFAVRGVFDGKTLKLDENVRVQKSSAVILTFLTEPRAQDDRAAAERELALLKKGVDLGGIAYSSRDELYDR